MVFSSRLVVSIFSLTSSVYSIAFATPEPTLTKGDHARVDDGWSPNPTKAPKFELAKRVLAGPETCGWYGDGVNSRF